MELELVEKRREERLAVINPTPIVQRGYAHAVRLVMLPYEFKRPGNKCIRLARKATAEMMFELNPSLIICEIARAQKFADCWEQYMRSEGIDVQEDDDPDPAVVASCFRAAFKEVFRREAPSVNEQAQLTTQRAQIEQRLKELHISVSADWPLWWMQQVAERPALQFEDWKEYETAKKAEETRERDAKAAEYAAFEARRRHEDDLESGRPKRDRIDVITDGLRERRGKKARAAEVPDSQPEPASSMIE